MRVRSKAPDHDTFGHGQGRRPLLAVNSAAMTWPSGVAANPVLLRSAERRASAMMRSMALPNSARLASSTAS